MRIGEFYYGARRKERRPFALHVSSNFGGFCRSRTSTSDNWLFFEQKLTIERAKRANFGDQTILSNDKNRVTNFFGRGFSPLKTRTSDVFLRLIEFGHVD